MRHYCKKINSLNILQGRLWLNHTTETANMKKALSFKVALKCLIAVVLFDDDFPY